ncbi:DKNYY domain-containing protein [Mesorhizobium sp. DCY119]|uniref:DKNYY domain-containing protein n=1 Tax=Mesorhizobium sp. DCY119 TaxID=2108445 RepID=UPI001FE1F652|nr:DKNYY domain-containing protein [Mesorhizobium sp. DCY119]
MRDEVVRLRRTVEANPRIGPFADVAWIAHYLGERRMPTIRYVHDGVHVRVDGAPTCDRKGIPLAGVDPFSFRQLGERWFRDDKRVYGQGETQTTLFWFVARNADPDTFTVLNERYAADKAAGYYITNLRLPTEEPGTFEIVVMISGGAQRPDFISRKATTPETAARSMRLA